MDNTPKSLLFGGANHNAPLADISGLSESKKEELRRKALSAFGTYSYDKFESDEEFELALACFVPDSYDLDETFGQEIIGQEIWASAAMYRGFYYHQKKSKVWKKEVLEPLLKDMADYALHAPQYDPKYLLELELKKMECMNAYFSNSVIADENGNYSGGRWLRLCIKLLGYLINEYNIPDQKILAINVRNVGYPISSWDMKEYLSAKKKTDRIHYGRKIYWHKAHRLYCHIREHALHTWWE